MDEKIQIDSNSGVAAGHIEKLTYYAPNPQQIKNSVMANILKAMLDQGSFSENNENISLTPYDICAKIEYNHIVKYKELFDNCATYYSICYKIVNTLDNERVGSKQTILDSILNKYLLIKGNFIKQHSNLGVSDKTIVQAHSDDILDAIFSFYNNEAQKYSVLSGYSYEEIELNIQAFLTYCFIECKILERPQEG